MVNWCPASKSAISDEEVIYRSMNGKLYYLKYPITGGNDFLIVATTRPETMLGDTAVAVNPEDERYKKFVGKTIDLPIVGRKIPIIADDYVDKEFGTGAVKITPAHDINDYEMGKRQNLEVINIFNEDASTNDNVPEEFRNLDRFDAKEKVVTRFKELGLLVKIEDYQNKVGYSERGGVPIEPYLSEQWFMKMEELSAPALKAVEDGDVKFHPEHWTKTYAHWMSNIKDWCISRQLWWGHRIPVWYHKTTKEVYCGVTAPKDAENWIQDKDVLDTWASSWLWAYEVFETKEEQDYYYPTNTLVTAPDIIFFWVARMIIAGLHFKKDIPFNDVYFTSIIRDMQGRKMSKSLGNSPDPLDVIAEYGADALRFTIIYLAPLGQDVLFSSEKCEIGRNFANKIWNAGRFLLMNTEKIKLDKSLLDKHIDFADQWILSRFNQTVLDLTTALDKFEINNAIKIIYTFVWNDFCDWFVELAKNRIYTGEEEVKSAVLTRAISIFENLLKIVHPFMPFITEEIWNLIEERKDGESISTSAFPVADKALINPAAEKEMLFVQDIITAIRNVRGEKNIPPSKLMNVFLKSSSVTENQIAYIKKLGKVDNLTVGEGLAKPNASVSMLVKDCEIYIPLEGLIDLDAEKARLQKEIARYQGSLAGIEKKLSNPKFVDNAPAEIIEKERAKQRDWEGNIVKLKEILESLS